MLKIDTHATLSAANDIARYHTRDELTRILRTCPADIAEGIRAHVERFGYRSGPAKLVAHQSFDVPSVR